jgi:hypothetical protein
MYEERRMKDQKHCRDGDERRRINRKTRTTLTTPSGFNAKLYALTADCVPTTRDTIARVWMQEAEYIGEDLSIARYFETLNRPEGLTDSEFRQLRRIALTFFVRDGYLFNGGPRPGQPQRQVIRHPEQREEIMRELHDETGHRGRQGTFEHVARRYQWRKMYRDCERFVDTCKEC